MKSPPLTIAIPKGRLMDMVITFLEERGIGIAFEPRRFSTVDNTGMLEIYKVKNHDLPTYVHHGITGLGIVGDDMTAESGYKFDRLFTFPFGRTSLCLAAAKGANPLESSPGALTAATSYVRMTREWFHSRGIPVKIINLNGSVELAPSLGLASCIVDLVETGDTLKANGLTVIQHMQDIAVRLIANPAYFKLHYGDIKKLTDILRSTL